MHKRTEMTNSEIDSIISIKPLKIARGQKDIDEYMNHLCIALSQLAYILPSSVVLLNCML